MLVKVCASGTGSELALEADPMNVLWGFSCSETAGTAATAEVVLRHGLSSAGTEIVAPINFAADGFGYPTFFHVPMPVPEGLYVERVSGETTVVLYWDRQ